MAGYLGSTPVPQATQHRESFTATEGQTSFATAGYTPQFLDVFLNGSHLSPADFVATNSSDVVLVVAASADDICDIISYTPFEVADQTFTGTTTIAALAATTITVDDNTAGLVLASTDADANSGPRIHLERNSGSPADGDIGGVIEFSADNDAGEMSDFARIRLHLDDVSNGTEDGNLKFFTLVAGAEVSRMGLASTETVFNEDSVDVDFRVESNSLASALFVEGSTGNVGIGIASPVDNSNVNLHIHDATSSGSSEIRLSNGSSGAAASDGFQIQFDSAADVYFNNREAGPIIFKTSDTERMQITSGGILKIVDTELSEVSDNFSINIQSGNNDFLVKSGGTTFASFKGQDGSKNFGTFSNGSGGFNLFVGSANTGSFALRLDGVGTSASNVVQFGNGHGQVGTITLSGTSTAYNTSSDYRLKENVDYDWDATTRLKQLKPARFNFIVDADTTVDGFLAHEAQAVVPEAVTGTKDAMRDEEYVVTAAVEEVTDADGNVTTEAADAVMRTRSVPDIQSIDQSKLVPLLVKTIQELEARITALEG